MDTPIVVNYEYTNNLYKAKQWLSNLPDLFAADFEAASKWTKQQKDILKFRLENNKLDDEERRIVLQQLTSNGLSHPSLTVITHLSVAWSEKDSYVIICENERMRQLVYNFLTNTDKVQIWHNSIFDFKHIRFHTGVLPKEYIDTQLISKCLLNDANSFRDRTGLKELMGYLYGDWALAKEEDTYSLENIWNPQMIKYAATDSPATYRLYQDIQEELQKWTI